MKTFERQLPEGYKLVATVDAKSKRTAVWFNVAAIAVMLAVLVAAWFALFGPAAPAEVWERIVDDSPRHLVWRLVFLAVAYVAYILLHELTHGAAYKLLTHQKLTFGMTLSVAYCGVPNIYVYRTTAMIALLAPFCMFLPVFALPMVFLPRLVDKSVFALLLASHLGGCVGDLYVTGLFLFRLRSNAALMRDTGPAQTFYLPESGK